MCGVANADTAMEVVPRSMPRRLILVPFIIYVMVRSAKNHRQTLADLQTLAKTHPQYAWLDAKDRATRARQAMEAAFEEAIVEDFKDLLCVCEGLPDPGDVHVLAAALKTQAATIVTENLKDFPEHVLAPLNIESRSADAFIADTIALDPGRAVAAIRTMRLRLKRPEKTAEILLMDMDAAGLTETVDVLRPYVGSL